MNYSIVIDAGHGGDDPGAISGNYLEKDFNLKVANYIYKRFEDLGVPVYITRDTDETLDRRERINRILGAFGNGDNVILLSNHINAGGGEGAEIVYALRNDDTLARSILTEIEKEGQIGRKVYQRRLPSDPALDYYFIIRDTPNLQSLLIEYGFIDNSRDLQKLNNELLNYGEAVVRAVASYIGIPYDKEGSQGNVYIVKKGDSLWSIARQFDLTINELRLANNLTSVILQIGQALIIPGLNEEEIPSTNIYTVVSGDSLWSIADKFNITVPELINLNNLSTSLLQIGQQLLIPVSLENPKNYQTYTVKKGDSLWSIARSYNLTVDDLINANNLTSINLKVGDVLVIPIEEDEIVNKDAYIVQAGDTLWNIANKFNITVNELKELNDLESDILSIGQKLIVTPIINYQTYTVKSGDTLWSIAKANNVSVNKIKELNNLSSNTLKIGQVLLIP